MSHEIYQTQAFILKTKNMRESNKLVYLYTERFGLIYASMQSVRELRAKMSAHVQTLSLVDVDVVQGRDIWRIVGIHERVPALSFVNTPWYEFFDNLASLLLRLCGGEETQEEVWQEISNIFALMDDEDIDLQVLEIISIIRILFALGYWEGHDEISLSSGHDESLYDYIRAHQTLLIQNINQALQDSQL